MSQSIHRAAEILEYVSLAPRTQSEIAAEVGISQMHVSRLLTKALAKLRGQLDFAA